MNFISLPPEIKNMIVCHITPSSFLDYRKDFFETFNNLKNISLVNKELHAICISKLNFLKENHEERLNLLKKYKKNHSKKLPPLNGFFKIIDSKILFKKKQANCLSALSLSGSLLFNELSKKYIAVEEIDRILNLFPESVHFITSQVSSACITPLSISCINPQVPIPIVEKILKLGADPTIPCILKLNFKKEFLFLTEYIDLNTALEDGLSNESQAIIKRNTKLIKLINSY